MSSKRDDQTIQGPRLLGLDLLAETTRRRPAVRCFDNRLGGRLSIHRIQGDRKNAFSKRFSLTSPVPPSWAKSDPSSHGIDLKRPRWYE